MDRKRTPSPPKTGRGDVSTPVQLQTPGPNPDRTLLDVLQRENMWLKDGWGGTSFHNTESSTDSFDVVAMDDEHPLVQPWTDFNFESIQLAYGDLLSQRIKDLDPDYWTVRRPKPATWKRFATIVNENSVDKVTNKWTQPVVETPIRAAGERLRPLLSASPGLASDTALDFQRLTWKIPGFPNSTMNPDWVVCDSEVEKMYIEEDKQGRASKPLVYAVGDNKLTQKWKSEWLSLPKSTRLKMDPSTRLKTRPTKAIGNERTLPLNQIAAYCRYAETRYAFLLTQEELVALRIRRIPRPSSERREKHHAAVEYASVAWGATSGLTVNLAIWALACMGMNDEHRAMEMPGNVPLDAMARLTWWTFDSGRRVYQNVISKRMIPEAQWDKASDGLVQLDVAGGNSPTSAFLVTKAGTAGPSVGPVTRQMQALSLGAQPSAAATLTPPASTTAGAPGPPPRKPTPKPSPASQSTTPPIKAPSPPPPAPATAGTKPAVNKGKAAMPHAAAPRTVPPAAAAVPKPASAPAAGHQPAPRAGAASSSTAPTSRTKQVVIEDQVYTATYTPFASNSTFKGGGWFVTYRSTKLLITRNDKQRTNIIEYNGREIAVRDQR